MQQKLKLRRVGAMIDVLYAVGQVTSEGGFACGWYVLLTQSGPADAAYSKRQEWGDAPSFGAGIGSR